MSESTYDALEVCLAALRSGADLATCLRMYPDQEAELRPLLESALEAEKAGQLEVPAAAIARSRSRLLQRAREMRTEKRAFALPTFLPRFAFAALAVAFALVLGLGGLAAAASQSLPGDALYPVKRAEESLSRRLTPGSSLAHEADLSLRRLSEVRELLRLGREEHVTFEGRLAFLSDEQWLVGEVPTLVGNETSVIGDPVTGQIVLVEGETNAGGWVVASEVRLRAFTFVGQVSELGARQWLVEGRTLSILPSTLIGAGIELGEVVIVLVRIEADDSWTAQAILHLPKDLADAVRVPTQPPPVGEAGEKDVDFTGKVEAMGSNSWRIGGQDVLIDSQTEIDSGIRIGDLVRVRAVRTSTGALLAEKIELESSGPGPGGGQNGNSNNSGGGSSGPGNGNSNDNDNGGQAGEEVKFEGILESKSGNVWVIGGQAVTINAQTEIKDNPQVGDTVRVEAIRQADGSLLAEKIKVEDDD